MADVADGAVVVRMTTYSCRAQRCRPSIDARRRLYAGTPVPNGAQTFRPGLPDILNLPTRSLRRGARSSQGEHPRRFAQHKPLALTNIHKRRSASLACRACRRTLRPASNGHVIRYSRDDDMEAVATASTGDSLASSTTPRMTTATAGWRYTSNLPPAENFNQVVRSQHCASQTREPRMTATGQQ
jgi:hypothetical protein